MQVYTRTRVCVSPLLASDNLVLFFGMLHNFQVDLGHCELKIVKAMDDLPFSKDSYCSSWKEQRIPADHLDLIKVWFKVLVGLVFFRFAFTAKTLSLFPGHCHYS